MQFIFIPKSVDSFTSSASDNFKFKFKNLFSLSLSLPKTTSNHHQSIQFIHSFIDSTYTFSHRKISHNITNSENIPMSTPSDPRVRRRTLKRLNPLLLQRKIHHTTIIHTIIIIIQRIDTTTISWSSSSKELVTPQQQSSKEEEDDYKTSKCFLVHYKCPR